VTSPVVPTAQPVHDRARSPYTGWTRDHWIDLLARLTVVFARAAARGGSPARPHLPGAPEPQLVEGLEGFARMSVAWGAWLGLAANPVTLARDGETVDVERLVAQGLLDGTDPGGRFGWGEIGDRDQRIVEAAELATGLWLGRERLAPALGRDGLTQVLGWLAGVHGRDVYDDNWVLFPSFVATVQRGFGQHVPDSAIDAGLDVMLARYGGDGWYADGPGNAFDQYTGWAVHWHLLLWSRIDGDRRPRVRRLVERRARTYLAAVAPQFAPDGSRPLFGRSLGYRFAAAAPWALGEVLGLGAVAPGLARRIGSMTIARHLADGALDPPTGWFTRGVAGERPDVCERYVSLGAAAWAAHVFVALALPPDAAFWQATEEPVACELGDGRRALRGPGLLLGWRRSTGETWVINGLSGHPDDIPGHDYTPYYGKLVYRSHHPFTVRTAAGGPAPDGAVLIEPSTGGATHRVLTDRAGVGPGWSWSSYVVETGSRRHRATTVVLPWRDVEVRLTGVRPDGPVRLVEAPAALATSAADAVRRGILASGVSWAASRDRFVAIRALAAHDRVRESGRAAVEGPDRNLVADHAEQPVVEEARPSARPRVVASVACAVAAATGPITALEAVSVTLDRTERWRATVRLSDDEIALVDLGRRPPRRVRIGDRDVEGPRLRVVRASLDGSAWEGEAILSIAGIVQLERAGPISVRRVAGSTRVDAATTGGFRLERAWAGSDLCRVSVGDAAGWREIGRLAEPGVVPTALVRRLQRETGFSLVDVRLEP